MSRRDGLRPDLALVADQIFDGSRVLDLGCGEGILLDHLIRRRGCRGTGVEIDPVSAGLARVLCPDHTIVAADIAKCEIPDGSFDAAIGNVPYSDAIKIDGVPLHALLFDV